ncbi:MAG TPA: c-type cytochrome [Gemmatimonadales bacterium]|nr:c-type cytochrome [Gemmatimonadales bacterium]
MISSPVGSVIARREQDRVARVWGRLRPLARQLACVAMAVALASCRKATPAPAARLTLALPDTIIPAGPFGASILRGRALLTATRDSLPTHVGNRLRCVSCHLDEGRRAQGTWVGVYARYPQYRSRAAAIQTIEGRVNDCFERSLNGTALPSDGRDMADIVSYFWWLSRGTAVAAPSARAGSRFAGLTADTAAGRAVFGTICSVCHGAAGQGTAVAPPVWGDSSFNIAAGMARPSTAAAFIRANMPFNAPGTLTDQQAFDVAAYVTGQRRPDFPAKIDDWPLGDPPADVPYRTRAGRRAQ